MRSEGGGWQPIPGAEASLSVEGWRGKLTYLPSRNPEIRGDEELLFFSTQKMRGPSWNAAGPGLGSETEPTSDVGMAQLALPHGEHSGPQSASDIPTTGQPYLLPARFWAGPSTQCLAGSPHPPRAPTSAGITSLLEVGGD